MSEYVLGNLTGAVEHHDEISGVEIGWAFGLTMIAGMFTLCGSGVVFCMGKEHRSFAMSMSVAFSAGVMLYVTFIEIFSETIQSFLNSKKSQSTATIFATTTVFISILVALLFDGLLHRIFSKEDAFPKIDPVNDHNERNDDTPTPFGTPSDVETGNPNTQNNQTDIVGRNDENNSDSYQRDILISGMISAAAVVLHNIPEGIVTFSATINDHSFGVIMCIAMGLHNIPEGVGVAALIYHATHSRTKAILATFLTGAAEGFGALVGYAIFAGGKSDYIVGVSMGFSAGIMIFVSVKKLIPLAYKIDSEDKYASSCIFAGMLVMAISLVLLESFS